MPESLAEIVILDDPQGYPQAIGITGLELDGMPGMSFNVTFHPNESYNEVYSSENPLFLGNAGKGNKNAVKHGVHGYLAIGSLPKDASYIRRQLDVNIHWHGRGHFFGAAAKAMQRILVENARRKKRLKAGGEYQRVGLSEVAVTVNGPSVDVLAVDEALRKLEEQDPRKAELVRLRFFAGLTLAEAAKALGTSVSTADNDWAYAKTWLRLEMSKADEIEENS